MLFNTTSEGIEFHFDENNGNLYVNKGKDETKFTTVPPLYITMYRAFGENTVKAIEFKSHDCDGLIYGGNLLTTTPSALPSFPTGCKSKCLCQSDVGNKISFNGTLGTVESGAMMNYNFNGAIFTASILSFGFSYILSNFVAA
uniref:Uncharacterized protein n=1 Tax=Panagrolaimus sp. ES5 TaxID=591445 RepID=A0AC34FC16_9BILA